VNLTQDEARALAFIGGLVFLSAVVRVVDRPKPVSADLPAVDVAALEAATRAQIEAGGRRRMPLAEGEKLDPNRATADELMRLPRARRNVVDAILAARAAGTRFETVADLDRVPGVGAATIAAWRGNLTLRDAPIGSSRGGRDATSAADADRRVARGPSSGSAQSGSNARARPLIDINRATAAELERLPGVGPALARRIVAYRDSVGSFGSVDQLQRVKGIGPALVARLGPLVRTGG
jgi:competence protein ComEA